MQKYEQTPIARRSAPGTGPRTAKPSEVRGGFGKSVNGLSDTREFRMQPFGDSSTRKLAAPIDPPLNVEAALRRLGGAENAASARRLLVDLSRFFLEDAPGYLSKLEAALAAGAASDAAHMAHTIKGQAAYFDGFPTQRAAFEIEKSAAAGDLTAAAERLPELVAEVERLSVSLRALCASNEE